MRERWAHELTARAAEHWTDARVAALTGGKSLPITPRDAPLLLRALGLLRTDASMAPAQVRKFLQINHVVRMLEPPLRELRERHATIHLLDAGCGRSYLTLLLAWVAKHRWGHPVHVLGVDRNAVLVEECRRRTEIAELSDVVRFVAAPLAGLDPAAAWGTAFGTPQPIHGVCSLHACDTATCDAIALGVELGVDLIAVAPCCQAELARAWATGDTTGAFAPIWRAGHLRRELGAHLTDAMRVLLLRAAGYEASAAEFVAAHHSAKNTLVRAVRPRVPDHAERAVAWSEYRALVEATGGHGLALAARLPGGVP